eukprot:scaffold327317_cov52-Tisochrysis_lutea.AAC.1
MGMVALTLSDMNSVGGSRGTAKKAQRVQTPQSGHLWSMAMLSVLSRNRDSVVSIDVEPVV